MGGRGELRPLLRSRLDAEEGPVRGLCSSREALMVINFRSGHPVIRPDEEPERIIIDVKARVPVSYSGRAWEGKGKPEALVVHKGPAMHRYSLPPGVWTLGGAWEVSVFQNGGNKPWCVRICSKRPFAVVTVPDYKPATKIALRAVK